MPFDTTRFVEVSIEEVLKTLAIAMVLVFLVVYLFLQSFRATLIPMIAVPVSLIGTFAGMYALGFSINTLTLFGLVLAIGIVVDDAIVVLENTERMMATEGKSAREAAFESMSQVTGPVVAIVLVLVLGVRAGRLPRRPGRPALPPVRDHHRDLGGRSPALVALTLTPALCAIVLREPHERARLLRRLQPLVRAPTDGFVRVVGFCSAGRALGVVLFLVVLLAVFGLFRVVPGALVPPEDQGYFIAAVAAPRRRHPDAHPRGTASASSRPLLADPAIEHVATINGVDFVGGGANSAVSTMFVILKLWDERKTEDLSLDATIGRFFGATVGHQEAIVVRLQPAADPGPGD